MEKCRICGWQGDTKQLIVREMMQNTKDEFEYFECLSCHCLQIKEVPENLSKYYGQDYYSYKSPDIKKDKQEKIEVARVLDVGCGAGKWLCTLANAGYVNLYGCDPFISEDLIYENGVKIYKKSIHEMKGIYDYIYLNDSFEHMTDPHEVMESIRKILAPQGVVRMAVPVYPNIAFDMFGEHWYQLDAPRHIFLHSKESMEILTKMHGLRIVKKEYDSNRNQIIRSFLYEKDVPFYDQTPEVVEQYFNLATLKELDKNSDIANENEIGDHAVFYLMHDE